MANIFSGYEIIGFGIIIEENGKDFYTALEARSSNNSAKKIFRFLAGEEEKHIHVFEELRERVEEYTPPESYEGEYAQYLRSLASGYVFTQKNKGKSAAQQTAGDKEAVDMGIGFEKDSILFYEGMKKFVPAHDAKAVDELISQEQKHLVQLIELKQGL